MSRRSLVTASAQVEQPMAPAGLGPQTNWLSIRLVVSGVLARPHSLSVDGCWWVSRWQGGGRHSGERSGEDGAARTERRAAELGNSTHSVACSAGNWGVGGARRCRGSRHDDEEERWRTVATTAAAAMSLSSFGHLRPGVSHKGSGAAGLASWRALRLLYQTVNDNDLNGDDRCTRSTLSVHHVRNPSRDAPNPSEVPWTGGTRDWVGMEVRAASMWWWRGQTVGLWPSRLPAQPLGSCTRQTAPTGTRGVSVPAVNTLNQIKSNPRSARSKAPRWHRGGVIACAN